MGPFPLWSLITVYYEYQKKTVIGIWSSIYRYIRHIQYAHQLLHIYRTVYARHISTKQLTNRGGGILRCCETGSYPWCMKFGHGSGSPVLFPKTDPDPYKNKRIFDISFLWYWNAMKYKNILPYQKFVSSQISQNFITFSDRKFREILRNTK
jgi:hypothetical protein